MAALIAVFCGASVLLAVLASAQMRAGPAARRLLGPSGPTTGARFGRTAVLTWIGASQLAGMLCRSRMARRRLTSAGDPFPFEVLAGMKIVCGVGTTLLFIVFAVAVPVTLLLLPIVALLGFRAPDFVLGRMARRRLDRIAGHVPDLVELLVATTEAGLSPLVAFHRSAEVMAPPLGTELRGAVRLVELGTPWRVALDQLVARTGEPSLRRLAAALTRSHRLGTSVGSALRTVAEDLRRERRSRAEELARRAPVKMLFPLVFLILPAFLLLTVGPVVLATIRSLH